MKKIIILTALIAIITIVTLQYKNNFLNTKENKIVETKVQPTKTLELKKEEEMKKKEEEMKKNKEEEMKEKDNSNIQPTNSLNKDIDNKEADSQIKPTVEIKTADNLVFAPILPVKNKPIITQTFQTEHPGVDIVTEKVSENSEYKEEIISIEDGEVLRSEFAKNNHLEYGFANKAGDGNKVIIKHIGGDYSKYSHNKENLVKVGDKVKKGQVIAIMGSTGNSTGVHLHLEITKDGKSIDPKTLIKDLK